MGKKSNGGDADIKKDQNAKGSSGIILKKKNNKRFPKQKYVY